MIVSAKWPGPLPEADEERDMFVITGITGKVGGDVARSLLSKGRKVRAVVRDRAKGDKWAALGCEVSLASISDTAALTEAFREAEGVFLLTPPNYDPEPGFPDTKVNSAAIRAAIEQARPAKVVFLSTVGAHVIEPNLLNNSGITEAMLRTVSVPVALLRAAWFMENAAWDLESARQGAVRSFLQPLAHKISMVSTKDIARTAAEMLEENWQGVRVVELEGPARYSADDVAAALAGALGTKVRNEAVPRDSWEELFGSQGMKNPLLRVRMLDGFNEGWIDFEAGEGSTHKGTVTLDSAIRSMISDSRG
jgi:NAD(P)H dehydrogenase (quinone)